MLYLVISKKMKVIYNGIRGILLCEMLMKDYTARCNEVVRHVCS